MLVTGVFAFAIHEVIYFGRFLPFLLADQIPQLRRYKLQPVSRWKYICRCVEEEEAHVVFEYSIKGIQDSTIGSAPNECFIAICYLKAL